MTFRLFCCFSLRLTPLFFGGLMLLLGSCANTIAPQGGPRDETPPKIVEEKSTPNFQTNFTKQPIRLTFDEWVTLKEAFQQVVISPPLDGWDLKIKGKTVVFEFPEGDSLRSDATYTINFGEAIQDLTEGNPADVRFVFSTGNRLDSLRLSGTLVEALTEKPVKNGVFMLYDNLADSVVRTERPFYFGKTGEDGKFSIENIKPGRFRGFALLESPTDYKYDDNSQMIGFPDSLIVLNDSLPAPQFNIRMFAVGKNLRLEDSNAERYGVVRLKFNLEPPDTLRVGNSAGVDLIRDPQRDSLYLWYGNAPTNPWYLYLANDTTLRDTIRVPLIDRTAFLRTARLQLLGSPSGQVPIAQPYRLRFNFPLGRVDTNEIFFGIDSIPRVQGLGISVDTNGRRELIFQYNWREGAAYQITLLPGAVNDIFGLATRDTIVAKFRMAQRRNFGNLLLELSELDSSSQYVAQILAKDGSLAAERSTPGNQQEFKVNFPLLPPGEYSLRLITDWNRNGRWDPGDYSQNRQPEPVFIRPLEPVRANWDVEAKIKLE